MQIFSISQLASEAGVNLETIRYYERHGLLPEPHRNGQGHRQYPKEYLHSIRFIKNAQSMGFSLHEISGLVALKMNRHATCNDVRELAHSKCKDIEEKIEQLTKIREYLLLLVETCPGNEASLNECPTIEAFNQVLQT